MKTRFILVCLTTLLSVGCHRTTVTPPVTPVTPVQPGEPGPLITTVAGNGVEDCPNEGQQAIASPGNPYAIAIDTADNIYFICGHSVYKINTVGIVNKIAGTVGVAGYSGDGGLAVNAQLNWPRKIVIDNKGNVYVADAKNNRIRKIDKAGIITTVVGSGLAGYSGDGGPATLAAINEPWSVAVDKYRNLYVDDHYRIRKVDTSGVITTIAGTGIDADMEQSERFSSALNL